MMGCNHSSGKYGQGGGGGLCTQMREEFQTSVLSSCCCFLAGYLAVAGLNLLAQLSDKIHHFTALNSVHFRKLG